MTRTKVRIPTYTRHKTGQGRVRIAGRDFYLGPHGAPESEERYRRLIAEWLNAGSPRPWSGPLRAVAGVAPGAVEGPTVSEVILAYVAFARRYYRKDGRSTGEFENVQLALRPLRDLYGTTPIADFGPRDLKLVRQRMIESDLARGTINRRVDRIRRMFQWAVGEELVPASVVAALKAVPGLRKGRSPARESPGVRPVSLAHVEAILGRVSRQVAAMVQLQLHTGMRPGEVVQMRACDLDTRQGVWRYKPASHKTEHHDKPRRVLIGPKAQDILRPFLKADLRAPLFSPKDAESERRAAQAEARKTPLSCGNRRGTNRKALPKRAAKDTYTTDSYRRAIQRACKAAGVPSWHPHQLRHAAGTNIRREFGIEMARVVLGHSSAVTSEIYAEIDEEKAAEVAAAMG